MSNDFSLDSLITKLQLISNKPHRCSRTTNDGGAGNLLEDLLGIAENNLSVPDFGQIELKTQRATTDSLLTLFHCEPQPRGSVPKLLRSIGWRHAAAGDKYPNDEMSFRSTTYGHRYSDRGFTIKIKKEKLHFVFDPTKVAVNSPDRTGIYSTYGDWLKCVETRSPHFSEHFPVYYFLEDLEKLFREKIDHTLLAIVKTSNVKNIRYHTYKEFFIMKGLNFGAVKNSFENGDIVLDFDARTKHNHGTKFRISKSALPKIFENYKAIKI